jgi:protein JSN1
VVNQKNEPDAAKTMLDAIFRSQNDQTLRDILQDQVHGVHAISKIVCSDVIIPPEDKNEILAAVKRALEDMRNVAGLSYKRLLEECGLPVPTAPASGGGRYPGQRRDGGHRQRDGNQNTGGNGNYQPRGYVNNNAPQIHGYDSYNMMPDLSQMMSSMQAFQLGQGMTGSLSPLLANQHSFGQVMNPALRPLSPTPTIGSFATPHAQLMSPNSDPFNPVRVISRINFYIHTDLAILLAVRFASAITA